MTEFETALLTAVTRCAVALERQAQAVEKSVAARVAATAAVPNGELSDAELDGNPRNDPEVKKNPKRWVGPSFVGKKLSQCPPEFLDVFANAKEFQAEMETKDAAELDGDAKAEKLKYARYSRLDAKRARAWARRIRGGWTPPAQPAAPAASWKADAPAADWRAPAAPSSEPKSNSPADVGYPSEWDNDE